MNPPMSDLNDPAHTPPRGIPAHLDDGDRSATDSLASGDAAHRAEVARLEAGIAAANARAAAATARGASLEADMREAMRKELVDAQAQLAAMDLAHEEQVARVRADAIAEIERIRRDARREVE